MDISHIYIYILYIYICIYVYIYTPYVYIYTHHIYIYNIHMNVWVMNHFVTGSPGKTRVFVPPISGISHVTPVGCSYSER